MTSQVVGGIVLSELVADGGFDVRGLVEGGDQHRDRRQMLPRAAAPDATVHQTAQQPGQQGIAGVDVDQHQDADGEKVAQQTCPVLGLNHP